MEPSKMSDSDRVRILSRRDLVKVASVTGAAALAGTSVAEAAPPPKKWDQEADVVVVGYGGAGACAAIAAADAGASVLLLEKQTQAKHYPNSRMAGGIFHSPQPDGNRAALKEYAKAMMSGENIPGKLEGEQPEVSDELAEIYSQRAPDNAPFLQSLDPDFKTARLAGASFPTFPGAKEAGYRTYFATYTGKADFNVPSVNKPKSEKMNGEAFFTCLTVGVSKRKNIRALFETPASRLVTNDKGEVIGVVAKQGDKEIAVKAKRAVVLTSGGYEYNMAMRKAFLEGPGVDGWAFYGTTYNTGDGIEMALGVGAGLMKAGKAASRIITAVPIRVNGLRIGLITDSVGSPNSLVVDNHGKRYASETLVTVDPSRYFFYKAAVQFDIQKLDYPRSPSWMVFDEKLRKEKCITFQGISTAGYGFVPWAQDNLDAIERGWILKGNTYEELAAKIKAHPDNRKLFDEAAFVQTMQKFNAYCAASKDEEFGRKIDPNGVIDKPPYYALPLYAGGPNTKGGISANGRREVLNWAGKPIARLFTAGEISSAFKFVYQGGGNLTECITFGRVAGENAAKLEPWS
jgi:succinate dehydrogenase/fumarate reductase flavoprotein subunit